MTPGSAATGLAARWRDFWFAEVPPHSFALYRIAVGLAGVATIIGAWDPALWRIDGLAPLPGGGLGVRAWLLQNGFGTSAGLVARTLLLAGYVCLALGVRSTFTAVAMFVGSSAMLWWNWYPFSGAQHLLHNLTLYVVWMDSGSVWSWDAWRARRQGTPLPVSPQAVWPLRLVRAQMAVMYFAAGLWKLGSPDWRGGDALHYILNNTTFQRGPGSVPAFLYPMTVGLTYVTLLWELFFPFLLWWRPARVAAIAIGVALHLGMWASLELGAFSFTVLAGYVAFLDPQRTEDRVRRLCRWVCRRGRA